MADFFKVIACSTKRGHTEIKPEFLMRNPSEDLMTKDGDFYAVWVEERGLWSKNEQDLIDMVDRELKKFAEEYAKTSDDIIHVMYMLYSSTGTIDRWHKYCQRQMRNSYHPLDEKLVFQNDKPNKKDYASKRLPYPLEAGECPAWERLTSVLYSPEEKHKIEWAIGCIISGDSKQIQKFVVIYGGPRTGKSTILDIIQLLFEGHYCIFDAKSLGNSNASFALEAFRDNPLVAIQQDGDLSRIEDNTRLNSIASHDEMLMNSKNVKQYPIRLNSFMFMGTNKPVRITDAKSGIIRRLIDISPTGNTVPPKEYRQLKAQVEFELGAIAKKCLDVYLEDPSYYDDYIPLGMLSATNDFYNFLLDSYLQLVTNDGISQQAAWENYNIYCEKANIPKERRMTLRIFKEEMKSYFSECKDRITTDDGKRVRNWYSGFKKEKFTRNDISEKTSDSKAEKKPEKHSWLFLQEQLSLFDTMAAEWPAQYANEDGIPMHKWSSVQTRLRDLDTKQLHFVKPPINHIVIDFDIPDENGEKCLEKNIEAVEHWPPTYAELSKSGKGIHLHYIYKGDPELLSHVFDDKIEIKVFSGNQALRRKLWMCNDLPVAELSSGLPLRKEDKVINTQIVQNEKGIRTTIKRSLFKEYNPGTKPSIEFIKKILDEAYENGVHYDVRDMFDAVHDFAMNSTNHKKYCTDVVAQMHFCSKDAEIGEFPPEPENSESKLDDDILIFFDVEVFPNLFIICWKVAGEGRSVVKMINPSPEDVEALTRYKLIGFNCRAYDNYICYARMLGYSVEQLYELSRRTIESKKGEKVCYELTNARNFSYTDVFDFSSEKKSLKKFEIELGESHQELGLDWNEPVPEELWQKVADYCANDVLATEAVWNARQADFMARQIQVELVKALHGITDVCVNDTTNSLSEKIIFGLDRNPQWQFNYRDLSKPVEWTQYEEYRQKFGEDYIFHVFDQNGLPTYEIYDGKGTVALPDGYSILPFFPGYTYSYGKSIYMGEEIGEGGRVYAEVGIHEDVWDGDIASQHPHSVIAEVLFGPKYTKIFEELVEARVAIKHKDFEKAGLYLNGVLKPWLTEEYASGLAQALKIVINSIYGLTSARFTNRFNDERNIDNIVAKRGALFMTLLKSEVQKRGYQVAHIKTDSIKIVHATDDIRNFVIKFGKEFGYDFETEAEFDKFCLVNDAVYVAKYKEPIKDKDTGNDIWWTATGTQFQVPYVFKTLFSGENYTFRDFCETKSVSKGAIVIDMNESLPQMTVEEEKELETLLKVSGGDLKVSKEKIFTRYGLSDDTLEKRIEELKSKGEASHNYIFVGRVGQFCPILPGCGGGVLYRKADGKYYAVTGTKDFRWLESEIVKRMEKQDQIDRSYYDKLVEEAIRTIDEIGEKTGTGSYKSLIGQEVADAFEWPPETPKY